MAKRKDLRFPKEVFITYEEGDAGDWDYYLVSDTLDGAFDRTSDDSNQRRIATYQLVKTEIVRRELKMVVDELPSLRASDDGCPKREVLDAPRSSDGLNVVTTQEEKA